MLKGFIFFTNQGQIQDYVVPFIYLGRWLRDW